MSTRSAALPPPDSHRPAAARAGGNGAAAGVPDAEAPDADPREAAVAASVARNLNHNRICNALGEGLWGMLSGFITSATVMPALLVKLHASDLEKGVLTAVELLGLLLPGLLGVYLLAEIKRYKRDLVLFHLITCFPLLAGTGLLIQFSGALPSWLVRAGVLAGFGLFSGTIGFIAPTWFHWLAALFPVKHRGQSLSYAVMLSALSSAAATFLASEAIGGRYIGWLRDHPLPYPLNFSLLFYAAAALVFLSMVCFVFVREPPAIPASGVRRDWRDIFAKFRWSLSEPNFRRFLIGRVAEYAAISCLGFFGYYFMLPEGGNLSEGAVTLYGAVMPVMTALFGLAAGRIGDRHGHKLGKALGTLWMVLAFALILFVPFTQLTSGWVIFWVLTIFALRGMFFGSMYSGFNFIFESCPHDSLTVHVTASNVVVGLFAGAAGVAAGQALDWVGHRPIYWAGLAASLFALIWLVAMVKDPRDAAAAASASKA
ncbi:MAG: MFS transporter [Planctomycetota bacterium]